MSNLANVDIGIAEAPAPNGRAASASPPREPPGPPAAVDWHDEARVDAALARAKEMHGDGNVAAVETAMGWAVFRAPTLAETTRYKTLLADDKSKASAGGILARLVVLSPSRETFGEWCDAKPMTPEECMNVILELAGLTGKPAVKK